MKRNFELGTEQVENLRWSVCITRVLLVFLGWLSLVYHSRFPDPLLPLHLQLCPSASFGLFTVHIPKATARQKSIVVYFGMTSGSIVLQRLFDSSHQIFFSNTLASHFLSGTYGSTVMRSSSESSGFRSAVLRQTSPCWAGLSSEI